MIASRKNVRWKRSIGAVDNATDGEESLYGDHASMAGPSERQFLGIIGA
jgi:hypothetical protein